MCGCTRNLYFKHHEHFLHILAACFWTALRELSERQTHWWCKEKAMCVDYEIRYANNKL